MLAARVKETGVVVGFLAAVSGAFLAASALRGLVDERDHLRSQVGALSHRPTPIALPPSSRAIPGSGSSRPASRAPGRPDVVNQPVTYVAPATQPTAPSPSPRPKAPETHPPHSVPQHSPTKPHPAVCQPGRYVTVRVPLGVLSCNTVVVGGSG